MPRIAVFGATGYTGRLVTEALLERGVRPLIAARSEERLERLADELGGLETAVADVADQPSLRALVGPGDVLITTVGPFVRFGGAAAEAAAATRSIYIDSTGEPAFIRRVFECYGLQAKSSGATLLTACGYDWVPGNLAAALALRDAGGQATRVRIGYFALGELAMSGGTRASAAGSVLEPSFAWRDGRLVTERGAARVATFDVDGRAREGVSVGASEHFALPRIHPELQEVDVYLGWFGKLARPMQAFSAVTSAVNRVPGARAAVEGALGRFVKGSTGGPSAEQRERGRSHVVATAFAGDEPVSEVHVKGVDGYTFTGRFIAWAAARAADQGVGETGAIGPAEAFGLDALETGCAEAGLEAVRP